MEYTNGEVAFEGEKHQVINLPESSSFCSASKKPSIYEFGCVVVGCHSRTPHGTATTWRNPKPVHICGSAEQQPFVSPSATEARGGSQKEREELRYSREHIVNHRNIPCTKGREQPHTVFIQLEEQKVSTSPRRTSLEGSVYWRTTGHSTGAVSAKVMPGPAKLCRLVTGCEDCEKPLLQWTTGAKIANKLKGNLKKAHCCWA